MNNLWVICCKVGVKYIDPYRDCGFMWPWMWVVAHRKIIFVWMIRPLVLWFVANCLLLVRADLPILRPPDFTTVYLRQLVWSVHFNPAFWSASAAMASVHAWPQKMVARFWRVAARADVSVCLRNSRWALRPRTFRSRKPRDSSTNTPSAPSSMESQWKLESLQEQRLLFHPYTLSRGSVSLSLKKMSDTQIREIEWSASFENTSGWILFPNPLI